ncbi:monosaccharide ABC transporter membrane protein (CUT2 family) [Lachnotalea glycerini]|uniref:Monosaccharide ABC transporter membrane protein (CUT2 family) n=1 Tax=Lachnotalea glycerini TaxID=1763509 RepID=A0A318ENQ5_9FIRM|nr:ABC transporter permease [Lachnotalea glycerini]OYO59431.1 ribose ABC transporter permease [Lachnotalea glycerini]PXV86634.1 monosaccharide ABC transporter membrane protein (CUT2 family) [Lachnotalea glycerini]
MKEKTATNKFSAFARENTMLLFLIVLFLLALVFVPRFANAGNLKNVLIQISINALIATGMTFVILSDGIDLSVGSVAALSGIAAAALIKLFPDANILLSMIVILASAVLVGGLCGFFNGFFIAKLNVPPFIATLAMMNVARGLAYVFTDAKPIFGLPESFGWVGLRSVGVIPVTIILMVLIIAIAYVILSKTCFGRYIYAVGSNKEVAKLSGINVTKIKFMVYMICGILAGLAGVVLASKLQNGQATAATGYELNAIAAVAMGGTSMSGGRGGMIQTIFGLFVIGIINNALSLLGVSSYWQTIAMGVIILMAVVIDQNKKD